MTTHASVSNRRFSSDIQLRGVAPNNLSPSEYHVRGETPVSDAFVRNVSKVGLVHPPICRSEDGELRVVDGARRVRAAEHAGRDEIPVVVYELTDAEATEVSFTLNLGIWRNEVTDRDEEAAMRASIGGPRRARRDWETDAELFEAKYALGLADDADRMMRVVGGADGVGEATALSLSDVFESPESVREATSDDLQRAEGVGPTIAQSIHDYLDKGQYSE